MVSSLEKKNRDFSSNQTITLPNVSLSFLAFLSTTVRFSSRHPIGCLVQESPKRLALPQNLKQMIVRKE